MADFLTVESASKQFGGLQAVDEVSFAMAEGALAAIIGPNGAGKTTLFNLIAGAIHRAAAGSLPGKPVRNAVTACTLGIARTFQNVRLFREMTVLENVMVGMGRAGFLPPRCACQGW